MSHWRELNGKISEIESLVHSQENSEIKKIDWNKWNEKISNKELLLWYIKKNEPNNYCMHMCVL